MVVHTDDFGRHAGDPFTVKHLIDPTSRRSLDEFARGLQHLHEVELVIWYEANGKRYYQISDFDPHQPGLHKRTASACPAPPHTASAQHVFEAREEEIEAFLAEEMTAGLLRFNDWNVIKVERQRRVGNAYLDLVVATTGPMLLIEVKRHTITLAAVQQVRRYAALMAGAAPVILPFAIGLGVDLALQAGLPDVGLLAFDERLRVRTVAIPPSWCVTLNHKAPTLPNIPSELKRTEQKGTELEVVPESTLSDGRAPEGSLWEQITTRLALNESNRVNWFEPCVVHRITDNHLEINTIAPFRAQYLTNNFCKRIALECEDILGARRLVFVVKPMSVRVG